MKSKSSTTISHAILVAVLIVGCQTKEQQKNDDRHIIESRERIGICAFDSKIVFNSSFDKSTLGRNAYCTKDEYGNNMMCSINDKIMIDGEYYILKKAYFYRDSILFRHDVSFDKEYTSLIDKKVFKRAFQKKFTCEDEHGLKEMLFLVDQLDTMIVKRIHFYYEISEGENVGSKNKYTSQQCSWWIE